MPETLHGLGRCRHRAFAALAGRTLRLVRLVNSLWSLPTTSLRLDWGSPDEGERVVRPALERAMKAVFGGESDHVRFLAHMIGLGKGSRAGSVYARLSPESTTAGDLCLRRALVSRLAALGPTVLVLEDFHWADPTSLRLTEELAEVAGHAPLLLVATRRPEPDPGVSALEAGLEASGGCRFQRVRLAPLSSARRTRAGPDCDWSVRRR